MSDIWFTREYIQTATEGMRESARKWEERSDEMAKVLPLVVPLELDESAFSVLDPVAATAAPGLRQNYEELHQMVVGLVAGAVKEFDRMGRALAVSAKKYDDSDHAAAAQMKGVW
jgi:hypothetical protein